jgi:hypothetical protein
MKKIIDGKMYNTETAILVAEYNNGFGCGDFHYVCEELYITKKGAFFLYCEGGALSKYSDTNGNSSWGICKIIALNEDEAYEWLERYNEVEAIEKYFSDRIEEA